MVQLELFASTMATGVRAITMSAVRSLACQVRVHGLSIELEENCCVVITDRFAQ